MTMRSEVREILVVRTHQNMVRAISTQNFNITAFNFGNSPIVLTQENITNEVKSLPREFRNRTIFDVIRDISTLSKIINAVKPDIVHINALQDLFSVFIATQICGFNGHKPAIIAMSRNPASWGNSKKAWLNAKLLKFFSDGFIALTTTHKNQLIQLGISANRITVIPNPFDPAQLENNNTEHTEKSDKTFKIIYVANICERKAQDVLINAASYVLKKYPNVKFELVGKVITGEEDYAHKLNLLIKKYGIDESIQLVGEIPYKKVLSKLQESNIFVFPTHSEMMPRAVIEAMVIGKPVIASAVDGILDLIEQRKTGILVTPGDPKELADAINELIENPSLAEALGNSGQKFILEFCAPERIGKLYKEFYGSVINRMISPM